MGNGGFQQVLEEPLEAPEDREKASTTPTLQGGTGHGGAEGVQAGRFLGQLLEPQTLNWVIKRGRCHGENW